MDSFGPYSYLRHPLSFLLSFTYMVYMASFSQLNQVSTSLCFYSLPNLLFLYVPRLANIPESRVRGRCLVIIVSYIIWKTTDSLKTPQSSLAVKGSGPLQGHPQPSQRGWKRGREKEGAVLTGNISNLIFGILRIIMDLLLCFWPRIHNTFVSLGTFPWGHWDPSVIQIFGDDD